MAGWLAQLFGYYKMEYFKKTSINNNIGKAIFIILLSLGLSFYLLDGMMDEYEKVSNLTLDEYVEDFHKFKEKHVDPPGPLWLHTSLIFLLSVTIFALYELTGAIFGWTARRVGNSAAQPTNFVDKNFMQSHLIPKILQDKVNRELNTNERIQWIDMPVPRFFTPVSTGAFFFGIPWTAFALFWTAGAALSTDNGPGLFSLFPMFGLPFILIGFGMLSSPIWAYKKALKTVYVITDSRAITFEGGKSSTIRSYSPDKLQNIYRKERKDGSGDVIINVKDWRNSDGDSRSEELGFLRIKKPKEVEKKLKKLAEQAGL